MKKRLISLFVLLTALSVAITVFFARAFAAAHFFSAPPVGMLTLLITLTAVSLGAVLLLTDRREKEADDLLSEDDPFGSL